MVRTRVSLHDFHRLLRCDDKKSFKLEYLSAGPNQPDAFTVSVNPLILFHLSLILLYEPPADIFFPQTFETVSRRPSRTFSSPPSYLR